MKSLRGARRSILLALAGTGVLGALAGAVPAVAGELPLAFAVRGVVAAVLVVPGTRVAPGTPLARLDVRPLQALHKAAEAAVTAASAKQALAQRRLKNTQELYDAVSVSAGELEEAKVTLTEAQAKLARVQARRAVLAWRLERSVLTAPRAGVIKAVPGFAGQVVDPRAANPTIVVLRIE